MGLFLFCITNPKFPRFLRIFFIEIKFVSASPRLRGATGFLRFFSVSQCLRGGFCFLVAARLRGASVVRLVWCLTVRHSGQALLSKSLNIISLAALDHL